jgi:predicted enzyme related to lactoylglutathione lyase
MPDVAGPKLNTPTWVDLASRDIEASRRFYGQIFGWEAEQVGGPEMGNYTFFKARGKQAAGGGSAMDEGQHPAWTPYIATDNINQTADKVRAAGGEVVMGPMEVPMAGHMCIFRDPTGAFLALWQAGNHKGFEIMREPVSYTWAELNTRDLARAKQFYQQVFGWDAETTPTGPGMPDYTIWKLNGEMIGGAMAMQDIPMMPADVPPHWLVYFDVEDTDRTAEQIKQLGGQVMAGPMDSPGGRFAVASDPQGAVFGIVKSIM